MTTIIPPTATSVTSATTGSATANVAAAVDRSSLADNFTAFLQLLTTQLKNQNPLEPLDTNQFTQQLVQFAQVEQQLKSNDQLASLVSLQKTAQTTAALNFVGAHVAVDGSTTRLENGGALWNMNVPKPSVGTVSIKNATGQTVYTGSYSFSAGNQPFFWDGRDASGHQWPDGAYSMTVTATDASGQPVSVTTEIEAKVESADLTASPPVLVIAGERYTLDKIKRVIHGS